MLHVFLNLKLVSTISKPGQMIFANVHVPMKKEPLVLIHNSSVLSEVANVLMSANHNEVYVVASKCIGVLKPARKFT